MVPTNNKKNNKYSSLLMQSLVTFALIASLLTGCNQNIAATNNTSQILVATQTTPAPASGPPHIIEATPTLTPTPPVIKVLTAPFPLNEMTANDRYKGEDGGLYGNGSNIPPPAVHDAAIKELAQIRPLDAQGNYSPSVKIVFISVGMSNTTQEFSAFKKLADADPQKATNVYIVDGAQGGQTAKI
jgi:hypothetical protein